MVLWPEKRLAVACALLLAGMAAHVQASTTAKESPHKPASNAAKSAVQTSGNPAKTAKSSTHTSSRKKRSKKTSNWRKRGQQKIDAQRARAIQEALIREHYLDGKASGAWDNASQNAMERYQADNGWQSKTVPDSRALIKLGLGPDHEHLLNPESAMTTAPASSPARDAADSSPPQK
ncbi:MAG: peptidoglycan-binding protein [Acidobacteriia bacterium]|nr:peptidoglycan-binding protein [Terriglobia bacterium]